MRLKWIWIMGVIINHTRRQSYTAQPVPPFMQELLQAGGLMNYVQEQLSNTENSD